MRKKLLGALVVFSLGIWILGATAAIMTQNEPLPVESQQTTADKSLWEQQRRYVGRMGDKMWEALIHIN